MARIGLSAAIFDLRASEMEIRPSLNADHLASLILTSGDQVWLTLNRRNPEDAHAQAEAMDRLAELASQAATWLRGGDLPEQAGGAL